MLLSGCGGGDKPASAGAARPASASASASPSCDFASSRILVRRATLGLDSSGIYVLTIAAGPPLCEPAKVSLSTYRIKNDGMSATVGRTEPVGGYDGAKPLSVVLPVLGSPCLTAVVHVGRPPDGQGLFLEHFTAKPAISRDGSGNSVAGVTSAGTDDNPVRC
jgi:hypothetical protein